MIVLSLLDIMEEIDALQKENISKYNDTTIFLSC